MEVVEASMEVVEVNMEVLEPQMDVVEASMEVISGTCGRSAVKAVVEISMEAPVYVRGSSLHGSFHGNSGSFQEQPEMSWKYSKIDGSAQKPMEVNCVPRKLPWKIPLPLS